MTDLGKTIAPKSDQLNADDLIAGPITITVREVRNTGAEDQPISIYFEGDSGKPYKPGKSMRRVLVQIWGREGTAYVGRSMTLYRDPAVKFGGDQVGGIRISHMTGIDRDITMPLTATRGSRKPYTVQPLRVAEREEALTIDQARASIRDAADLAALERVWRGRSMAPFRDELAAELAARKEALGPVGDERASEGGEYVGV